MTKRPKEIKELSELVRRRARQKFGQRRWAQRLAEAVGVSKATLSTRLGRNQTWPAEFEQALQTTLGPLRDHGKVRAASPFAEYPAELRYGLMLMVAYYIEVDALQKLDHWAGTLFGFQHGLQRVAQEAPANQAERLTTLMKDLADAREAASA